MEWDGALTKFVFTLKKICISREHLPKRPMILWLFMVS